MKLSNEIATLINEQVNHELQSSYAYLAIALWFETTPYQGFAAWMRKQSDEEIEHAHKFIEYMSDRGNAVELLALAKPEFKLSKPIDAFRCGLEHEEKISGLIRKIYAAAEEAKDYETKHFLSWFLEEQVEEEASAQAMIDRLELAGDHAGALLALDAKAGDRA